MQTIILGDGHLGWAIAAAAADHGERTPLLGRPAFDRHDPAALVSADLVIDASRGG
jgi:phosphoribosylaminoimidazole carboxylase (NCAIR synthetase)